VLSLFAGQAADARGPVPSHRAAAPNARAGALTAYRRYRHYRALHAHRRRPRLLRAPWARAAVVGGALTSIEEVPWQVYVFAEFEVPGFTEKGVLECGGSIIDVSHILTAAHCMFDPATGVRIPAANFHVVAGVSTITEKEIKEGPTAQPRLVESVRIHPDFDYAAKIPPDDVSVLRLAEPLKPSAAVRSIALPSSSATPPEGANAVFSGYGEENGTTGEHNEKLYSLSTTLVFPRPCGREADAVFLCARNPAGSVCFGDSGGALSREVNGAPTLIGVIDLVYASQEEVTHEEFCGAGALNGFVNLAAPEIRDFVEGSENPPLAPRGGAGVVIRGVTTVGHPLTCEPGGWSNGPTFSYAFVDRADGLLLQDGPSPVYSLTEADVGRTISCEVMASNEGGTGLVRTEALPAIKGTAVAQGSAIVQSPPAASAPESPNPGAAPASISASEIAALLRKEITPAGESAKIASLLKASGFIIRFKALEAGSAVIDWYQLPPGAKLTGKTRVKPVLIASGRMHFSRAGSAKMKIKLTAAGKHLLRSSRRLKLTAKGTFTPTGKAAISVTKTFVLSA
jgi:hypothetical protein